MCYLRPKIAGGMKAHIYIVNSLINEQLNFWKSYLDTPHQKTMFVLAIFENSGRPLSASSQ